MKSNKTSSSKFLNPKELLSLAYERERACPSGGNIETNIIKAYKDYQLTVNFLNEIAENEKPSGDEEKKTLEKETLEKETFGFLELCKRSNSDYIPHPSAVDENTKTAANYLKRLQDHYQEVTNELEKEVRVPSHLLDHESKVQTKCRKAYNYITPDLHYIKSFNERISKKSTDFSKKDISRISHMSRRYKEKKLTLEKMVEQIELEEQAAEIF